MKRFLTKILFSAKVVGLYRNWPQWFLYRLRFYKDQKERVMKLRSGLKFVTRFDLSEPGTIDDILIRNEYFTPQNAIPDRAVVIDIGANIGAFSVVVANRAKEAMVFSYEPTPDTFSRLVKNINLNGLDSRIKSFNLAVAGDAGEKKLFLHPKISGANTLAPYRENLDFVKKENEILVRAVTLGDVFRDNGLDHCDFLKMDCEGAEYEIIMKTPPRILAMIRHIALEYHKDPQELKDSLRKNNFEVTIVPSDPTSGFLFADKIIAP
jgi:FkbM family methyltransferase